MMCSKTGNDFQETKTNEMELKFPDDHVVSGR